MPRTPRLTITSARLASTADLEVLRDIEVAADTRFAEAAGQPLDWPRPPTGRQRAAMGGWLVVVGSPAVGFAHVLDLGGQTHLEQLSVLPEWGRRGVGEMLLGAAYGLALDAGHRQVLLRTFADVPWNGPWYAAHGFRQLPSPPAAHADLERREEHLDRGGHGRFGRRISMARAVADEPAPVPAVSVLPVRDGPEGIEGFVQHRVATMDFAAGAVVFPGGRVDPGDTAAGRALAVPAEVLAEHAQRWRHTAGLGGDAQASARTILATAVREVAEETGARIDPARLVPWDDWITPVGNSRRFDVRFLLYAVDSAAGEDAAAAAAGTVAAGGPRFGHTTTEAHHSEWLPLAQVVRRAERGELALLPPTRTLVDELCALQTVAAALALAPEITAVRHDLAPARPRPPRGQLPGVGESA